MSNFYKIANLIHAERIRQDQKWGVQNHKPEHWQSILMEELGEVAKEVNAMVVPPAEQLYGKEYGYQHLRKLREELIQSAAVIVAWLECLERAPSKEVEKIDGETP